jgi:UPF0716 protein FxsA
MTRFVTLTAVFLPFLEIPGFVLVSRWIGVIPMLILVLAGALGGILVLRQVGLNAVVNLRLALAQGTEPGHTLIDAACFALGGFLLTVPGFISDLMAFALFLPWTRDYLLRRMARHFEVHVQTGFGPQPGPRAPESRRPESRKDVIDGEYSVVEPDAPALDTEKKQDRSAP